MIAPLQAESRERLEGYVFGGDEASPRRGPRLAAGARRDDCRRGVVHGRAYCSRADRVPGSSRSFLGGVVAYDNSVKIAQLGVSEETIEEHGAVSEETAREMARGAASGCTLACCLDDRNRRTRSGERGEAGWLGLVCARHRRESSRIASIFAAIAMQSSGARR